MLLCAALCLASAGPIGTVITFEDQPNYLLPTPESLFFRQYSGLGLTNVNSSAAGGYILGFPSLLPNRTFIPPHSGWQAAWVHCAGAPLPPTQRLEFSASQQTVMMWVAVSSAATMRFVVGGAGSEPIQALQQACAPGSWTLVTITAPSPVIRSVQATPTDAAGAYRYIEWAIDDITLIAPVQACGSSDVGSTGGVDGADGELNNNDFIVYIDRFFAADPRADVGVTGGVPGSDGQFNNNDFVVFIDDFFGGCG